MKAQESFNDTEEKFEEKDDLIESVLNSSLALIESDYALNSSTNYDPENAKDHARSDIDNWFNDLLKQKLNRKIKNDSLTSKLDEGVERLQHELNIANGNTYSMI